MSPLRRGRARVATVSAAELGTRTTALSMAILSGGAELDSEATDRARRVVDRSVERSGIGSDLTVVALAGATGSGKSSLFNALVGEPVATIGARRPTTSRPTAAVWGDADASELLDWLGVTARHRVAGAQSTERGLDAGEPAEAARESEDAAVDPVKGSVENAVDGEAEAETADVPDEPSPRPDEVGSGEGPGEPPGTSGAVTAQVAGSLDGLVLLDLPDFDSREQAHRDEAERVLELVDVFVWVTDPQKYADARLHDEFVAHLSHHDAVTLGVLNQVDRLPEDAVPTLTEDLARLLAADGVRRPSVLATSTVTGEGLADIAQRLANAVAGHAASRQRLKADVVGVATVLRRGVADSEADVGRLPRSELDASLARAAGVPIVLDAVARDYRREAFARTGWLFARWTKGFTADPMRRLRLDRTSGRAPIPVDIESADVRAVLGRSSIPAPSASTVSAVDLATRSFVRDATEGLPVPWVHAVEDAVLQGESGLSDALDRAMLGTSLRTRRPVWWFVVDVLQWAVGLAAIGGLAWLAVTWVLALLQIPQPEMPRVGILPVPLLLLVGGLLLGLGLGALSRVWARAGARRRRRVVERRLTRSVATVADERVLIPVDEVLVRHRETREHLEEALG